MSGIFWDYLFIDKHFSFQITLNSYSLTTFPKSHSQIQIKPPFGSASQSSLRISLCRIHSRFMSPTVSIIGGNNKNILVGSKIDKNFD